MITFFYCCHANADFVTFRKMCKGNFNTTTAANDNEIFCILKAEFNVFGATYRGCCRNFVEFQIVRLKASPDTFPLATIACNLAERCRRYDDVDFDYDVDHLETYYNNYSDDSYNLDDSEFNDDDDDDDDDDEDDDDESAFRRTHGLYSSTCYTDMRLGLLRFTRFCSICQ